RAHAAGRKDLVDGDVLEVMVFEQMLRRIEETLQRVAAARLLRMGLEGAGTAGHRIRTEVLIRGKPQCGGDVTGNLRDECPQAGDEREFRGNAKPCLSRNTLQTDAR